ncbi:response regulator [Gammaproteobacteria bacterium]|nr:response regulator [Gammaproteobacteria bacterium]
MSKQARLSNKIVLRVGLVSLIGLLVGVGIIYSKEKERFEGIVHDKVERVLLALKSSHTQAMLHRGDKADKNPVLLAFNGTVESLTSTQNLMEIWLIMGPKVIDFQKKAGSSEIEPPKDEVGRAALSSLKPVRRYLSNNIYRYTVPVILGKGDADNPACFRCHQADMGIQTGEVIGGFSVAYNAVDDARAFRHSLYRSIVTLALIAFATAFVIVVGINRLISRPIEKIALTMDKICAGDREIQIPDPAIADSVEIAEILRSLQTFGEFSQSHLNEMKRALDEHSIVSISDIEGNITYVNDKFCEFSGYSQEELLGQNHRILKSGEHPIEVYTDMWDRLSAGKVWKGELKNKAKSGKFSWGKVTIVPFLNKSGIPYQFIAIRTDITDEKNKELELRSANKAAEAASVAKSAFVSTVSHEIRTPLNVVLSIAQLLKYTSLTDVQKEYLQISTHASNNLLSLINDILDFSKLDSGKIEIKSIDFDLEQVCQESIELVASNAIDKELEFIFDYHPDCPRHFMGDPSHVRQVLMNLLGNAIKFTNDGFIRLGVSYHSGNSGEAQLRLEVEDTGIGLEPETTEHLFEDFTQADNTTTREHGGAGLGLAITKKLVTLMGGEIGVNSVVGEGATFWVNTRLPRSEITTTPKASSLEGARILFVDGCEENLRVFKRTLEHMGANPTVLSGTTQALEQLRSAADDGDPFEIVILDHNMPDIDGLELGAEIRSDRQFDELKLFLFSWVWERQDTSILAQAGFNAYSNKLVCYDALNVMLAAVLKHTSDQPIVTQYSIENTRQLAVDIEPSISASVLLVEDVYSLQITVKELLAHIGIDVDVVSNGQEAIDAFSAQTYDLIFMDCRMPVMDGYKATRAIRQLETESNKTPVPIIAMTANASSGCRLLCQQAGMNEVITKPFTFADLSDCVQQWLPRLHP